MTLNQLASQPLPCCGTLPQQPHLTGCKYAPTSAPTSRRKSGSGLPAAIVVVGGLSTKGPR